MKKLTTIGLALAASGLLAGCGSGGKSKRQPTNNTNATTAPNTTNTNTAPTSSQTTTQPAWDTFHTAAPAVQNDSITAIHPLASGEYLVGHATGPVDLVDAQGNGTLEGSFGSVSSFAEANGRIFLGTSQPFFTTGQDGQVHERTAQGWTLALDHPLNGVVVAALGNDVYAFASSYDPATPDATVSSLPAGAAAWTQDQATLADGQVLAATAWNGEVWAGGSPNDQTSGLAKMWHGSGATWTPVMLPGTVQANTLEIVTDVLAVGPDLYIATVDVDTLAFAATGGRVFHTNDGVSFNELQVYNNDAPISLAWHDSTLFVGTIAGRLVYDTPTALVEDNGIPTNTGVFTLHEADADTLLVGVRNANGAEIFRRVRAATQPQSQPPQNQPAETYLADIKPILQAKCAVCHADTANPAHANYPLSPGLADDMADYTETHQRTDSMTPEASPLLRRAQGLDNHTGGGPVQQGSADYQTIVSWIQAGVPFN